MSKHTPICNQVESMLNLAPGEPFQDREAWRKVAFSLEEKHDALVAENERLRKLLRIVGDVCSTQDLPRHIRDLAHQCRAALAEPANEKEPNP